MAYTGAAGVDVRFVNTTPYKPVVGLLSITLEIEGNLPVKVLDRRGRELAGVLVSAANPPGPASLATTDANGNAIVQANAGTNTVTATKNQTFKVTPNNFGTSLTVILDPPPPNRS